MTVTLTRDPERSLDSIVADIHAVLGTSTAGLAREAADRADAVGAVDRAEDLAQRVEGVLDGAGEISVTAKHSPECWKRHVPCLVALVRAELWEA